MKKLILSIFAVTLLFSGIASAKLNKTIQYDLGYGVRAETVVTEGFNEKIVVNLVNNEGTIGTLSLSASQPIAKNMRYKIGNQKVFIKNIELGNAAYDTSLGSVTINSRITDRNGRNSVRYVGLISSWENY